MTTPTVPSASLAAFEQSLSTTHIRSLTLNPIVEFHVSRAAVPDGIGCDTLYARTDDGELWAVNIPDTWWKHQPPQAIEWTRIPLTREPDPETLCYARAQMVDETPVFGRISSEPRVSELRMLFAPPAGYPDATPFHQAIQRWKRPGCLYRVTVKTDRVPLAAEGTLGLQRDVLYEVAP